MARDLDGLAKGTADPAAAGAMRRWKAAALLGVAALGGAGWLRQRSAATSRAREETLPEAIRLTERGEVVAAYA